MPRRRTSSRLIIFAAPVLLAIAVAACGGDDAAGEPALSPQATEGRQIVRRAGCVACHGSDGGGGTGPPWTGALGTEISLTDGTTVTVDEAYLSRSIADPDAEVHEGYAIEMPKNRLSEEEIVDVV
ncbi:MAG: cytochrome c, partial [Chloroflexota bacterium]